MSETTENKLLKAILLFGPPGSGKGTIGAQLKEIGPYVHVSSGDVFRQLRPDSKGGQIFQEYASKGQLVPDDVTIEIIEEHIRGLVGRGEYVPEKDTLVLDGIPRNKKQAEVLAERVDITSILILEVPDVQVLVDRIAKRAEIEGRGDDKEIEVLKHRFEVFEKQTKEVLEFYPTDLVHVINADQSKEAVYKDIVNILLK